MAISDLDNKTARLAIAHGRHPVGSQDKLVKHDVTMVGTEQQVTLQQAGGRGPWDACEALYYDGMEIGSSDYTFHAGGESDAPDAFFPSDAPHPGASYVNVRLPSGMAADDRPEKLVGIYRTLKTADYDELGRQLDSGGNLVPASANPLDHFFYMPNPANVTADYMLRWFGRPATRINWQAWRDWREWCWEEIEWDDGSTVRMVRRFECHIFFLPPFRLAQVLDRIAQISCADWQDGGGELHFLTPANRSPVFTIDLSKVAPDSFRTWRIDRREQPREVVVQYRDLDDPLLYPADPVVVPGTGSGEAYVVNMGSSTRSQAERVGYYWKRVLCDAGVMAEAKAAPDTYTLLPADAFLLTHDEVDWTNIPFQVVTKDEHGDADLGDNLIAQIYPADLYSDTDHGPATTPLPTDRPNPYAVPEQVTNLTLDEDGGYATDGGWQPKVLVSFDFGEHPRQQIARVEYHKGDGEWKVGGTATKPAGTSSVVVAVAGVEKTTYTFRVVVSTRFASASLGGATTDTITVTATPPATQPEDGAYYFDTHNNLVVTWNPGTPPAGVLAQGEEVKRYKVTAKAGDFGGTVARGPVPVETLPILTATWEQFTLLGFPCTTPPTSEADGTVTHAGHASEVGCVMLSQVISGDCEIYFEVGAKFPPRTVHVINYPANTTTQVYWETTESGGVPTLHAGNTGVSLRPLPGQRYGIRISRRQAEFIGPSGQAIARSADVPLEGAYRVQVSFGQLGGEAQEAKRVTIAPAEPEVFVYTAEQMSADGLNPGVDTVYVQVVAVSNNPSADDSDPLEIECEP